MDIQTKRIYEKQTTEDGFRILVDRMWPRGITKEAASIDFWSKEIAPSNELRKWFAHDDLKWQTFKKKYFLELKANAALKEFFALLATKPAKTTIMFIYAAKNQEHNNAIALKEFVEKHIAAM